MNIFILISIITAILFSGAIAIEDYFTGHISRKLTFSMILIGIALNLTTLNLIVYAFGGATLLLIFGIILYRARKLGLGDTFLLVGLQLLLPFYPPIQKFQFPFSLIVQKMPFILTIIATAVFISFFKVIFDYRNKKKKTIRLTPYIFIALLLNLYFGNIFFWIIFWIIFHSL